jgi:hypothetical protein
MGEEGRGGGWLVEVGTVGWEAWHALTNRVSSISPKYLSNHTRP